MKAKLEIVFVHILARTLIPVVLVCAGLLAVLMPWKVLGWLNDELRKW